MKPPACPSPPPLPQEILERDSAPPTAPDLPIAGVEIDLSGMGMDEPPETASAINAHIESACEQLRQPHHNSGAQETLFTHLNPEALRSNLDRLLEQLRSGHSLHALSLLRQEELILTSSIAALEEERWRLCVKIESCEGDLEQWRREIIVEAEKRAESGGGTKLVAAHKRVWDAHIALASMGRARRTVAFMHKACLENAPRTLGKLAAEYGAVVDFEPDPWTCQFVPGLRGDARKQELERKRVQLMAVDHRLKPLKDKLAVLQYFFQKILDKNLAPLPPRRAI